MIFLVNFEQGFSIFTDNLERIPKEDTQVESQRFALGHEMLNLFKINSIRTLSNICDGAFFFNKNNDFPSWHLPAQS